jgi:hypothetical protein
MKSISKIGVTLPENNCGPINLEITEINGPGTTSYLDVEGILPTDPLWDTWEWQINVDWVFNATNANWTTSQIGGLIFNLAGDDTSVRVKFTKGSCVYYSNVSGMYDHPSYDCPTIELFIPPFITDVGNEAVLNIDGITGASPLWNTWKWQVAVNYLPTPTPNPTWVDAQTGGLTYTINTDDTIIRVVLTNGNCIYYSNESGYEKPNPSNKYYAKANIEDVVITGTGTLNISNVLNLGNGFNIDPTTDRITNITGTQQYVKATINLGVKLGTTFLLTVHKNGIAIPNFKIYHEEISDITTISFTDIVIMNNNDYLTFVYDADANAENMYGNIIVETINSYINIP